MMKIGAIVQARMSSQRLPGKMLHEVQGKPLLQYIIERLEHCSRITDFVIATSSERSDDKIEEFCKSKKIPCYRGSLNDVASRFQEISEKKHWDVFVRINGDSPLIDQDLISAGIDHFLQGKYDLVTNVFPRSYPPGQSVEIVRTPTFTRVYSRIKDDDDFEHVTRYFYQNQKDFKIFNFSSTTNYSQIHLSVDTSHDMSVFSTIIKRMQRPHWDYHLEEIISLYKEICEN